MRSCAALVALCSVLFLPRFVFAAVVIDEVLFDPSGVDTGLEKIKIYNPDAVARDLSGWELYPDGIGYFSFPAGFALPATSFALIHLRTSGADDALNLYHATPSSNMGNSSGSVALFRPGGRSKDTIADFVRYHKPGSSERKTWESAAAGAALWSAGTFVDISGLTEGNVIRLNTDGVRGSASSWGVGTQPLGSANAPAPAPPAAPPSPAAAEPPPPPPAAAPPVPSLGADAGPDVTALAGASIAFSGTALGLDAKPLPEARFLWNFGDGSLGEGRVQRHTYHFPGTYQASLSVQSGHYAGADWRMITIIPPALRLSEVQPGDGGFVELSNGATESLDLGGIVIADDRGNTFRLPEGTTVGAGGAIVLANAVTGLDPVATLTLGDARGAVLDTARWSGSGPAGASWERFGDEFVVQRSPTPSRLAAATAGAPRPLLAPAVRVPLAPPSFAKATEGKPPPAQESASPDATTAPAAVAGIGGALGPGAFFAASIMLGAAMAAAIVALKRAAPPRGST